MMQHWKVFAAVGLALLYTFLVHSCGQEVGRTEEQLANNEVELERQKALNDAVSARDELQRQLNADDDRKTHEHTQAMATMQRNAAAYRAESDSLRGKLAELQNRLRGSPTSDPGTGFQLPPGVKAAMVLSELLSSCSAERSELAGKYDESHARGVAAVGRYNEVREFVNKKMGQ